MLDKYLEFMISIADEAREIMFKYFDSEMESSYKGDDTIVTVADKEINDYLIKRVKEEFPDTSVLGEEDSFGESRKKWICDPIDGTAMFARGIPTATFSLAYAEDGIPLIGVVYDVFTGNLYTAVKGHGAYKNGEKIHVSDQGFNDMHSVGNFDMWSRAIYDISGVIYDLHRKAYMISIGSVVRACVAVASGEFVCAIFPGGEGKNIDMAAVKVIVEEAGGVVTNFLGGEDKYDGDRINGAVASNGVVHKEIMDLINKHCNI